METQVILRYRGDIERALAGIATRVNVLGIENFAVVQLPLARLAELLYLPEVLYAELAKELYFYEAQSREGVRLTADGGDAEEKSGAAEAGEAQSEEGVRLTAGEGGAAGEPTLRSLLQLTGRGILLGIPDTGFDLAHPDFRNADGSTRVAAYWDQQGVGAGETAETSPYGFGVVYDRTDIDRLLSEQPLFFTDVSGHGTGVAGIAGGNGRAGGPRGPAWEADFVLVRLAENRELGFVRSTALMLAVDFCLRVGAALQKPVSVNLSYGTSEGSHTGGSLLAQFMDAAATSAKCTLTAGTGNEALRGRHFHTVLAPGAGAQAEAEFVIGKGEGPVAVQLWTNAFDAIRVAVRSPAGWLEPGENGVTAVPGVYFAREMQSPISDQLLHLIVIRPEQPVFSYEGLWSIVMTGEAVLDGAVDLWIIPYGENLDANRFLQPSPETTLTAPATAQRVISVGAIDTETLGYAPFSGQGPCRGGRRKPELSAPGVGVLTTIPGGGYGRRTGTSFASPYVAGLAALVMEWGLRQQNPYVYGEAVRDILITVAKPFAATGKRFSTRTGWGWLGEAEEADGTKS